MVLFVFFLGVGGEIGYYFLKLTACMEDEGDLKSGLISVIGKYLTLQSNCFLQL